MNHSRHHPKHHGKPHDGVGGDRYNDANEHDEDEDGNDRDEFDEDEGSDMIYDDVEGFADTIENDKMKARHRPVLKHQLSKKLQAVRRSLHHVEGATALPEVNIVYDDVEELEQSIGEDEYDSSFEEFVDVDDSSET
jgi:hypothetical protein